MRTFKTIATLGTYWLGLLAGIVVLAAADPAVGQGFMVQPMRMEVTARAGQSIEVPLKIRNLAGGLVGAIDLKLVDLSQGEEGSWRDIVPDSGEDTSDLSSSLAWSSLSDSRVEIAPFEPAEVMLQVRVPPAARGAYFAAIIAEAPATEDVTGLAVRVRFLVPVIVEIDGRPSRQRVELDAVEMVYHGNRGGHATTTAHLRVSNRGQTFSRVSGQLRVERENDGRWRPVTRFEIADRAIIPGVTLELSEDLKRRLPSGTYRLRADLLVDGRRIEPLEREVIFEGDPNVDTLAYDTALILTPDMVRMDVVPGATRTTALTIENPGDDPVTVRMAASTPRSLVGVEMGELQGSELSAEPWTEIRPAEFTIRAGGRQNVRVMSRVPREGVLHANYYADLVLEGVYEDGQSAGETRSTVQLFNGSLETQVDGTVEQLLISEGDEPSRYIVQLRFANTGTVHLAPTARAFLLTPQGRQVLDVVLTGEEGALLPLARRRYSGEIDVSELEPGYYALRSSLVLADDRTLTQQQVLLVEAAERKTAAGETVSVPVITLVDPEKENLPEGLEELDAEEPALTLEQVGAAPATEDRRDETGG